MTEEPCDNAPGGAPGLCVELAECTILLADRLVRPEILQLLRETQCGFAGTQSKVTTNVSSLARVILSAYRCVLELSWVIGLQTYKKVSWCYLL